jgi:protein-S-isoprenylcysteine O-methyltransferase Ste14
MPDLAELLTHPAVPLATWCAHAGGLYVVAACVFRARYGRWPMAYSFPPRDAYSCIDMGLSLAMWSYFAWAAWHALTSAPPAPPATPDPHAHPTPARTLLAAAGVAIVTVGWAYRLWTLRVLGPNWRMGQDESDHEHRFVLAGPYLFAKHPINTGLIFVALGHVALTAAHPAALALLAVAIAYHAAQSAVEERYWLGRSRAQRQP